MIVKAYITRETEAAIQIVTQAALDNAEKGAAIRPLWLPRGKMVSFVELDEKSLEILTAQDGLRVGTPAVVGIDDSFAAKVGVK